MSKDNYLANDYLDLTVKHLRKYRYYKVMLENMQADIKDLTRDLQSESIKTAAYGDSPGGGGGSPEMLTATERAADRRLDMETERGDLQKSVVEVKGILVKIDRAMEALTPDERTLVQLIHFDRAGYRVASDACHFTERHCGRLLRDAEKNIALMLYGPISEKRVHFIQGN